jgi:hypothetical protein
LKGFINGLLVAAGITATWNGRLRCEGTSKDCGLTESGDRRWRQSRGTAGVDGNQQGEGVWLILQTCPNAKTWSALKLNPGTTVD